MKAIVDATPSSRPQAERSGEDAASTAPRTYFDPNAPVGFVKGGNLPHWRQADATYFITWRTNDSMPRERIDQWLREREDWLAAHPEPHDLATRAEYDRLFPARWEQWLDEGYGGCLLARPEIARIVTDILKHDDGQHYSLNDFVVMPNHVHALVTPIHEHTLSKIVQAWKSVSAHAINKLLGRTSAFWQKESFDHIVRNADSMERFRQYIRDNRNVVDATPSSLPLPERSGGGAASTAALACGIFLLAAPALHAAAGDWLSEGTVSPIHVFDGKVDERAKEETLDLREKVTIRRINPQCYSDWNNDPTALPYFFYQMERRLPGYPIYVNNDGIKLIGDEIFDYPIIYFTSHYSFTFSGEEVENLQRFLAQGGSLWLDDCTGSGPFMNSVPMQVQRIAPGAETRLMLMSDPRFNDIFRMIYSLPGLPDKREDFRKPFQATLINGRPAITFTPNDYGCDWEVSSPPTSMNPLGNPAHDSPSTRVQAWREQVYQICINWLFYTLTH